MATISGYNSYSMGVLFSGLNTTSSKNSLFSNSMSGSDILGINYSDWATIRSGSYFKLLNAYYGKGGQVSASDDTTSSSTSTSKDSTRTLAVIESDAKSVEKSVAALQETGDKSLFNEVTKTDENGNKTTGYDTDAIYKAVKNFTDSYNSLIDEVGNSNTKSILRAGASMVNVTEANRKSLSDIGISIGADNKLTIDEEKFKKTDMSKVKAMFADSSYYGTEVKRQAGRAESYASKNDVLSSAFDGIGMGLGFTLGLTLIGIFRELLGSGAIFGFQFIPDGVHISIFVMAPGAFFVLAGLTALQNRLKMPSATNQEEESEQEQAEKEADEA